MKLWGKILLLMLGLMTSVWLGLGWYGLKLKKQARELPDPMKGYIVNGVTPTAIPTESYIEPGVPVVPTKKVLPTQISFKDVGDTRPWGVSTQVDEHTWTLRVGMDKRMGTPEEILKALNEYRVRRGSQQLTSDESLADYAQERAVYLNKLKSTDGHKGFSDFLENGNGYEELGFTWLGENISYGYQLEAVHLIEWMYAGDLPHDENQVNNRWNYVGIGVDGLATAIIFGTGKK